MNNTDTSYLSVFTDLVKTMVQYPDEVAITISEDAEGLLLVINVEPSDRGRVIGREGRTANAIRTIAHVIAATHGTFIGVKVGT